jgi:hypothetical protein
LEQELRALEKEEIPAPVENTFEAAQQIKKINFLRDEMLKIIQSDAFESLQSKN